MTKSERRPRSIDRWWIASAIFVCALALFSSAIRGGFVNFDDDVYVYANRVVSRGVTFSGIVRAFSQAHARNWHPLTTLSHMLDCEIFGLNPAGPHAVNIFLHALSAAMLFLVLERATKLTWRSSFVAFAFAIHPLRVESVAWISERKDVLSALFFVCTLAAYIRYARVPSWRSMMVVIAFYAAGLMAKPMLVMAPLILLLLDFWPLRRFDRSTAGRARISLSRALIEKIPLLALALCSCWATIVAARSGGHALVSAPFGERCANAIVSYCVYIGQLFWPVNLGVFYPLPFPPGTIIIITGAAILLTITILSLSLRRRFPYLFVGWLWYLIMLVPVIGIVQIGLQSHADRYTYLPQIGLLIVLTWGVADLARTMRVGGRVLAPAGAVICVLLGWLTWQQLGFWKDSEILWLHALAVTRDNDVALNNLGTVYESRGELNRAVEKYEAALTILDRRASAREDVSRALVHNNLGNVALKGNNVPEALDQYQQSLALRPDFGNAHVNLAQTYAQQAEWESAITEYEKALHLQPQDADAQHRAGVALLRLGRLDEAIAHYRAALAEDPSFAEAQVDLGNALLEKGHVADAAESYRSAARSDPRNTDAHFNLARIYLQQRRVADAINEYEHVVAIQPRDSEAHVSLGNAFAAGGLDKQAVREMEKALDLAPESVATLNNLAWLLASSKDASALDPVRAISLAEKAERLAPSSNALIFHTLAAAYAAAGRKNDAIAAAERCEQLASAQNDTALADAVRRELASYRQGSEVKQ